ncbi:MAG: hypothetical protein JWR55_470 [Aeromicrobium sp.]|jgi:hypothetical protein|nr:hypothetical protein [Aeromicrobium sp.]
MFKKAAVVLGASAVVALAGPAMAAAPYTVDVGTFTSGSHSFTASTTVPIAFSVAHGSNTVNLGCSSGTANGSVTAGTNATGANVGAIGSSSWTGCIGPGNLAMNVTQVGTWSLNLTGNETAAVTDDIDGNIGNVEAHVAAALSAGLCNFDVVGEAAVIFHETVNAGGGQDLQVAENGTGNLFVDNVVGCFGAISNGDPASFATNYNVNSPDGAINVR